MSCGRPPSERFESEEEAMQTLDELVYSELMVGFLMGRVSGFVRRWGQRSAPVAIAMMQEVIDDERDESIDRQLDYLERTWRTVPKEDVVPADLLGAMQRLVAFYAHDDPTMSAYGELNGYVPWPEDGVVPVEG